MARDQNNQNSSGVCEKLYNAFRLVGCNPMHSNPAPSPPLPTQEFKSTTAPHASLSAQQLPSSGEVDVPIEFDPYLLQKLQNPNGKTTKHQDSFQRIGYRLKQEISERGTKIEGGHKVAPANSNVPLQEKKLKPHESMNDKFSAYILRVKNGIMNSSSNVGSVSSRHAVFNETAPVDDNASDYIPRAHAKMRATSSSLSGGKSVTFK